MRVSLTEFVAPESSSGVSNGILWDDDCSLTGVSPD